MSELETKIKDTYLEHKFHNVYDPKCSTCYSNALNTPIGERVDLLIDNRLNIPIEVDGDDLEVDNYDYDKDDADYHANKDS